MPDDFETTPPSDGQSDRQPEFDPGLRNVVPDSIDRFRIRRILGKGGFGVVYLAFDEQLERQVAIKVPNSTLIQQTKDLQLYLKEARTVARLEHPNIVPVFEVGGNETCPIYIVSKYIEGMDLATRIRRSPPSNQQAAQWINDLSQALRLAHSQGIVHRDIKPQNILVDLQDRVFLVDFGLALRDEEVGKRLPAGGTPAYMSPEQAKGEGHRVDGRSDIFSLGVVFYEMLARHRPFHGDSSLELFEQIIELDPKPLRQWNDSIDRELERICQKMLSKRKSTRYSNAADLSDDLSLFVSKKQSEFMTRSEFPGSDPGSFSTSELVGPSSGNTRDTVPSSTQHTSGSKTLTIVPKGLRSFDYADADFFLELLPGPRDREGLPDGLSFWKSRIEERDPERTFPVGLIYGSSGCGKSSMMKAGLLPRLSKDVVSIYIEATPHDTERTLQKNLQKRLQLEGLFDAAESTNLASLLASVRRGGQLPSRKKLLIVIDQFEQWLHVHTKAVGQELLDALEQCDGSRVQAIVMVRDDFWMAATRFFQDLDILLLERTNSAAVDLFDLDHAERVLKAFGRAYGKLAPGDLDEKKDRKQFITESVKGLSENNKVISVRLALFAEMMKGRPWTIESLREVGGTTGIGATFLEETFSAPGAPPEHRYLQGAARSVLRSLLPDAGTDIKGHMRSREELFSVSGCQNRPRDFESLVRILDSELRLITPVDRYDGSHGGKCEKQGDSESELVHFQLTHDYLVPSLREWLTRKQRETKRGRAELKLAERAASWSTNRENKQLPSVLEWLSIISLTHRKGWTVPQRAMMKKAGQTYMLRGGIVCIVLIVLVWGNLSLRNQMERKQAYLLAQKDLQQKEAEAEKLVEGLLTADPLQLPSRIAKLKDYHKWAKDDLTKASTEAAEGSTEKLVAGLALIANETDVDSRLVEQMGKRLLDATPQQFLPIRTILAPHKALLIANYWSIALDSTVNPEHRLHSACALADFDGSNLNWDNQELSRFL
jgi:serine/threonine protein kinase